MTDKEFEETRDRLVKALYLLLILKKIDNNTNQSIESFVDKKRLKKYMTRLNTALEKNPFSEITIFKTNHRLYEVYQTYLALYFAYQTSARHSKIKMRKEIKELIPEKYLTLVDVFILNKVDILYLGGPSEAAKKMVGEHILKKRLTATKKDFKLIENYIKFFENKELKNDLAYELDRLFIEHMKESFTRKVNVQDLLTLG